MLHPGWVPVGSVPPNTRCPAQPSCDRGQLPDLSSELNLHTTPLQVPLLLSIVVKTRC